MEQFFEFLFKNVIGGGQSAVISILVAITVLFGWWILRQDKIIEKKDEQFQEVVDKRFEADNALRESIDQLRMMIFEFVRTRI